MRIQPLRHQAILPQRSAVANIHHVRRTCIACVVRANDADRCAMQRVAEAKDLFFEVKRLCFDTSCGLCPYGFPCFWTIALSHQQNWATR